MTRMHGALALAAAALLTTACTAPAPGASTSAPSTPAPTSAGVPAPTQEIFSPVLAHTLSIPDPAPSTDGKVHLAYELVLDNAISQDVTIESVSVLGDGEQLLELEGDEILAWSKVYGQDPGTRTIGGGRVALVWLDVVVDSMDAVPATLSHTVSFSVPQAVEPIFGQSFTEEGLAALAVDAVEPIVIGPPLRGPGWLDGSSCCTVTPHRGAINPINGSLHAPERFAIDYVQLDADGYFLDGPIDELSSYPFHGADILAVGDGPIVSMVWNLPEQTPGANPTGLPVEEYGGNHIVQDLGGGHFAFYAHLQPDNPMGLEVGQVLERGEVIGYLGNSGNTDAPHLHFHIMDSPLPLASNGLPFLIDSFDFAGRIPSEADLLGKFADGGPYLLDTIGAGPRENESPLYLDVMDYPE